MAVPETDGGMSQTFPGIFLASAARFTDRPALVAEGNSLSYGALRGHAFVIARAIAIRDPDPEVKPVALFAYRSVSAYAGLLGIMLAGKAYVPLNPRFPAERCRRMLDAAGARIIIVDRRCASDALALLTQCDRPLLVLLPDHDAPPEGYDQLTLHHLLCRGELPFGDEAVDDRADRSDDGAYLLFTSGSTGDPKGILVTHANVLSYRDSVRPMVTATEHDRVSQAFDLTFDPSVHDMVVAWSAGACLCCVPENALIGPAAFIHEQGITLWGSVPSTISFMQKFGMLAVGSLPGLRSSMFCGEALPASLAAAWKAAAPNSEILNLYGPTEATITIVGARWRDDGDTAANGAVPIGHPFPGQRVAVVDEALHRVTLGSLGELCLAGPQITPGYWQAPHLTADRFVSLPEDAPGPENRWYRTGDIVGQQGKLGLVFHGRVDQQVKIRGFRVEITEIETVIRTVVGTDLAAAIGWPSKPEQGTLGVVAFVVAPHAAVSDIIAGCRIRLPDYMVPSRIMTLDTLPLNANGKTDYGALRRIMENERV